MRLSPFRIERYYERYEFDVELMLSSSDCESWTIDDLLDLEPGGRETFLEQRCGYTESRGARYLREAIASIYETIDPDEVLVLSCAEEAIFVLYHSFLAAGDHAVVETPCYESALELARSTGCDVSTWNRRFEDSWAHDLGALHRLIRDDTKLLYVNTPHNPTGTHMDRSTFDAVTGAALHGGAVLLSDEVYRELEHDPSDRLPAACDVYERGVALGSMSKTYGLPGLRLGWIATHDRGLLEDMLDLKYYTTICSSGPSEFLAALALRNRETLVERNLGIVHRNLSLLDAFFSRHADRFEWIRPTAGPIGFPRALGAVDVAAFCEEVAGAIGVLLLPGAVYDDPAHLRVGFGRDNMPEALARLEDYISTT